jgi:protein phosphatase
MTGASPRGLAGLHDIGGALACGLSDIGPVRTSNEDNFLIDPELGLLAVADGMGGHQGGEVASAAALDSLHDFIAGHQGRVVIASDDPDATWTDPVMQSLALLRDGVAFANDRVYALNQARQLPEGSGMGTTLTGFWRPQPGGPLLLFHVGDSRLYRYRADALEQLTRDQTWYQQALEAGKLDALPPRNLLLQALGPSASLQPDIGRQAVLPGDLLMLCSDGLHGCVPHFDMAEVLAAATVGKLEEACRRLVALAHDYGGRDNITVLLVLCER